MSKLDERWIRGHVDGSDLVEIEKLCSVSGSQGVIFATGHLGSFELLGHALAVFRRPLFFVAREFKNKYMNAWWQSQRHISGNETISNRGAYKPILKQLEAGCDVAIPFDQNVRHLQAVFVNWFGVPAATSSAPARAALKTGAPLVVMSMTDQGGGRYRIRAEECDYSDVVNDSQIDKEEKVRLITQRISDNFCQMITETPEQWFWMHRRWKSAPGGGDRDALYSQEEDYLQEQ